MKSRRQDTQSENRVGDALHKLRGENRKLRKKIKQLQKELARLMEGQSMSDWYDEDDSASIVVKKKPKEKCPKCSTEITLVPAGIFEIKICSNCDWRKRKRVD